MNYTSAEWLTIIAALGVLVTSIGGVLVNVFVSIRNGQKTDGVAAAVAAGNEQTTGLSHQVQEVHTLTNSNLSAVKAELATASAQIAQLHDVVTDLKTERGKTAAAAALRVRSVDPAVATLAGVSPQAAVSLANIDANTAAIDENTKRTTEKVEALAAAIPESESDKLKRENAELRAQLAMKEKS